MGGAHAYPDFGEMVLFILPLTWAFLSLVAAANLGAMIVPEIDLSGEIFRGVMD